MEDIYKYYHSYKELADNGVIEPLTCWAGHTLTIVTGPKFRCYYCNTTYDVGSYLYNLIKDTVNNFI